MSSRRPGRANNPRKKSSKQAELLAEEREGSNGQAVPQGAGSPAAPAGTQQAGAIRVVMLPVARLRPSGCNPNTMSVEVEAELAKEVRRLGRVPKPVVVRAKRKHFEIIDGEHSWKAARECGLTEVPCEVIEVDTFEAMRQMLTRNRHGDNDPVKLGRLYQRMMGERDLSQRALATEIGISEGTIRNFLAYAEAAKMRNDYAGSPAEGRQESADAEIARLTVQQVRSYLDLAADQRDEWFDAGARLDEARLLKPARAAARQQVESEPPAIDVQKAGGDAAGVEADTRPEAGAATPSAGDAQESPTAPAIQDEPFDPHVLDNLDRSWQRANQATRQKFVASVLAEPNMLAFARRIIKQGS
jgi:ParB/RepB/Spo0J family partition protein